MEKDLTSSMITSKLLKEIEVLITPTKGMKSDTIEDALLKKLNSSAIVSTFDQVKLLEESFSQKCPYQNQQWWTFLNLLMQKLLEFKCALLEAEDKECLISLSQFQIIKSSLQILVSFGILAHLSPGIGIGLEQKSSIYKDSLFPSNNDQKTYCLNLVLRCIMSLREVDTLRNILIANHTGDCLAAIFQLLLNTESLKSDPSNKLYLQEKLSSMIEETSQPLLIKELMLLNGNKGCPAKLSRAIRLILKERLLKDNGVIATAKAILDAVGDPNSPKHWAILSLIARLISTPNQNEVESYREKIYPQVLRLLATNEMQFAQIAVLSVRHVSEADPVMCQKYFIDKICNPLLIPSTEDAINCCIDTIYNCIGIPSSQHWALSPQLFKNIHVPLFRLFCFVVNSPLYLKNKLRQIVSSILSEDVDYEGFVFGSINLKFNFGEHGGVSSSEELQEAEEIIGWGDVTDILLNLVEENDKMKVQLFKAVIPSVEDGPLEKKLVGIRILSELVTCPSVLKWIDEEPTEIICFIKSLLEGNYETEIICLGLMVLSVMLNCKSSVKHREWSVYNKLIEPLRNFNSKSDNVELKVLANEIYCTILTKGAKNTERKTTVERENVGQYSQAIKDVTDVLLPVRAHALRQLSKLILSQDPEAHLNKETIFCIFKENLKCEDSYVYLSATEGLASLASVYPDEILLTLTEQFVYCKIPETRLKIGEVLMRVIRLLGEMAIVYKNEIINALLSGCRDSDYIVRASSLSSLGELCRILSFRINAFLLEIFECIRDILEIEKTMEPRRAAVMLLTSLLKGLGSETLSVLESVLLNIYRMLKYIYNNDKDDITKLHAQLAIEELNSNTIAFLCPPQSFKKEIFVLHPPTS